MDPAPRHMTQQSGRKPRPGFNEKAVAWLSVVIIVCGVLSAAMSVVALVVALLDTCRFHNDYNRYDENYRNNRYYDGYGWPTTTTTTTTTTTPYIGACEYYHTYMSAGIWAGIMFIASGTIGILSAQRKTTCFIVSMMVMALVTAWIAVVSMVVSIFAQFDAGWNQVTMMPITMRVANGTVTLFGLIVFILSWVKFGFACRAVCCNGLRGYPKIKESQYQYQPLPSQAVMYARSQPTASGPGLAPVPVIQSHPTAAPGHQSQPIYLVQGHRVIGMLPQNPQQPVVANTATTSAPVAEAAATVVA